MEEARREIIKRAMEMGSVIRVPEIPACEYGGCEQPAVVYGKLFYGPGLRIYMCVAHFEMYGMGLGRGYGEALVLESEMFEEREV
jgi:hypothetical protein